VEQAAPHEGQGREGEEKPLGETHEAAVNLLYVLIVLHLGGVIFETRRSGRGSGAGHVARSAVNRHHATTRSLERKALILTLVLGCQVLAAMFFTLDVAGTSPMLGWHLSIELGATLALAAGVVVGAIHVRSLIERARQDQSLITAARGAMLIRARFAEWRLTAAEADVALFAIKGLDVAEIAACADRRREPCGRN
jgi:hypothetical protein